MRRGIAKERDIRHEPETVLKCQCGAVLGSIPARAGVVLGGATNREFLCQACRRKTNASVNE